MRRPLQAIAARVEKLAADQALEAPAPAPDDPGFMAWMVTRYGLARLLTGASDRADRDRSPSRRKRGA